MAFYIKRILIANAHGFNANFNINTKENKMQITLSNSNDEQFYVSIIASNNETLMWSETYTQKHSAKDSIKSLQKNAWCAPVIDLTNGEEPSGYRFEIDDSTNGQYIARFRASNNEIMISSETYTAKHNAINVAESISNGIQNAKVVDNT